MPYRLFPRRLRERVGRRGLVLVLFGVVWMVQGTAFFALADLFAAQPHYFLIDRLPLPVRGGMWLTAGVLSVAAGLRPRREDDTLGFLAVSAMPMLVGASTLIAAITYAVQGSPLWMLGALSFLIWLPIIAVLAVVASWPEPPIVGGEE